MKYNNQAQAGENRASIAQRHRLPHQAALASSMLKPLDWAAELKIRREDVGVFAAAATYFNHIIAVRATNTQSLRYVGHKGFTPKPIDCKPKTAQVEGYVRAAGWYSECAGLVVDPTMFNYEVFESDNKKGAARKEWEKFLVGRSPSERAAKVFRRRESKGFFAVDTNKTSKYYGCLMLSEQDIPAKDFELSGRGWSDFRRLNMRYIHGDYDLYGLIDIEGARGCVTRGRLHGVPHFFTEKFESIKPFLNAGIGAPMIQHGQQDVFAHQSDELYVFYPGGEKYQLVAKADAIEEIYRLVFKQDT
jgi:hypothetical protein